MANQLEKLTQKHFESAKNLVDNISLRRQFASLTRTQLAYLLALYQQSERKREPEIMKVDERYRSLAKTFNLEPKITRFRLSQIRRDLTGLNLIYVFKKGRGRGKGFSWVISFHSVYPRKTIKNLIDERLPFSTEYSTVQGLTKYQ